LDAKGTNAEFSSQVTGPRGRLSRSFWVAAGTFFLCLGVVGIVLPILPTTPFLLLALACYLKGSRRMYDWVMANRVLGSYLRNYMEGRGIPIKVKVATIALLWLTISLTVVLVLSDLLFQIILLVIALAVTVHIATIRTYRG